MLNQCVFMGRLTRDPELRHTQNNLPCCTFALAVERDRKPDESGQRGADFIDCVAWRGTAEFVYNYFAKGRMAVVTGRMTSNSWQDRDGTKRKSLELTVQSIYFGDSKPKQDQPKDQAPPQRCAENYGGNYRFDTYPGGYEDAYAMLGEDLDLPFA